MSYIESMALMMSHEIKVDAIRAETDFRLMEECTFFPAFEASRAQRNAAGRNKKEILERKQAKRKAFLAQLRKEERAERVQIRYETAIPEQTENVLKIVSRLYEERQKRRRRTTSSASPR
jgi:hypothetical protein